jgi:hypothetical protein
MSNEPFQMSRANRGTEDEPEPTKPAEKPERIEMQPESKPTQHRTTRRHLDEKPPKNKMIVYIVSAIIAGIVVAIVAWIVITAAGAKQTGIDSSKYQAVFFTNGQVYFGKLTQFSGGYLRLTDVYYLQQQASEDDSTNPQKAGSDQQSTTLIKLGDEIHGPEDEMIISEEQVLFYENLKKEGKVSQSIEQHKKK